MHIKTEKTARKICVYVHDDGLMRLDDVWGWVCHSPCEVPGEEDCAAGE